MNVLGNKLKISWSRSVSYLDSTGRKALYTKCKLHRAYKFLLCEEQSIDLSARREAHSAFSSDASSNPVASMYISSFANGLAQPTADLSLSHRNHAE